MNTNSGTGREGFAKDAKKIKNLLMVFFRDLRAIFASFAAGSPLSYGGAHGN